MRIRIIVPKKFRLYWNALYMAIDGLLLLIVLLIIVFGFITSKLPWPSILITASAVFVMHLLWISPLFWAKKVYRMEWYATLAGTLNLAVNYCDEIEKFHFLQKNGYKQNSPAEAVVFFGYSDYLYLDAWIRGHVTIDELRALSELLEVREHDFSFYTMANAETFMEIMENPGVKRVYLVGHGSRRDFVLNNGYIIDYKLFGRPLHEKEFVHQVHCGNDEGERLIDLVVPEENRDKCFFFPEILQGRKIVKELKRLAESERALKNTKAAN